MSYKPIDNKRDQFRRYVENNGVIEMLSKVLIQLMSTTEKPENPIDFIRENVGASNKEKLQIELLQQEVNAYRQQVEDLTKQLEEAKRNNNPSHQDVQAQVAVDEPFADASIDAASSALKVEQDPSELKADTSEDTKAANDLVAAPAAKENDPVVVAAAVVEVAKVEPTPAPIAAVAPQEDIVIPSGVVLDTDTVKAVESDQKTEVAQILAN